MKKMLKLALITLGLWGFFPAQSFAQYYPYGGPVSTFIAPVFTGYYLYGCLSGSYCSKGEKIATGVGLGVQALDLGVAHYDEAKARQQYIQEQQYRAAEAQAAYNPQRVQDFQNIQNLNSFFLDTPVSPQTPSARPALPNGNPSPQITPAPSREMRP